MKFGVPISLKLCRSGVEVFFFYSSCFLHIREAVLIFYFDTILVDIMDVIVVDADQDFCFDWFHCKQIFQLRSFRCVVEKFWLYSKKSFDLFFVWHFIDKFRFVIWSYANEFISKNSWAKLCSIGHWLIFVFFFGFSLPHKCAGYEKRYDLGDSSSPMLGLEKLFFFFYFNPAERALLKIHGSARGSHRPIDDLSWFSGRR